MVTVFAAIILIHIPIEGRARALLAEVTSERTDIEEADEGEEFANAILKRCS
jgi:hypothetical protein